MLKCWQLRSGQPACFTETRYRVQKPACVGVLWCGEDRFRQACFDELPTFHDQDALTKSTYDGEIVGNEQQAELMFFLCCCENIQNLCLHADIESADRFIANEELWMCR